MVKYSFLNFIKNIKYLFEHSLKEVERDTIYTALSRVEDVYRYEIMDSDDIKESVPVVLDSVQTLQQVLNSPRSFVRFGDGEIKLMEGHSIPFQKYDEKLAEIMLEILKSNRDDLYIGINYSYFHTSKHMNEYNRKFYLIDVKPYRDFLIRHCNLGHPYIAAGFNQMYICSENMDLESYYEDIKNMFKGKKLIIFVGRGVLDELQHDVFQLAESKEYIYGPALNAFEKYDEIYKKAMSYGKDKVLCFILGPASKALVYRLTKEGYMAWDIGHMAKDYDYYCKKTQKTDEAIVKFFAPD